MSEYGSWIGLGVSDGFVITDRITEPIYNFKFEMQTVQFMVQVKDEDGDDVTFYKKEKDQFPFFGELYYRDGQYYGVRHGGSWMYPLTDSEGKIVTSIPAIEEHWTPPECSEFTDNQMCQWQGCAWDEETETCKKKSGKKKFDLLTWIKAHPQEAAIYGGIGGIALIVILR